MNDSPAPPTTANAAVVADFLHAALLSRFEPAALTGAAALATQPAFDWDAVCAAADDEALAPLLHALLGDQPWLPAPVADAWRTAYLQNAARNSVLFGELARLINLLTTAGIEFIVLKGAALATVYGDVARRPMVDIDLLLQHATAAEALRLLETAGFRRTKTEIAAGVTLAYENEVALVRPGPVPIILEVHWSLFDSPYYQRTLPMAWFWETRQPATIKGIAAAVLGPEAQLLHLCAHLLLHHHGQGLLWKMDLALLLQAAQERIDWDVVVARAVEFDLVLSTRRLLAELAAEWRSPVPPAVIARLAATEPSAAELQVVAWLTAETRPVLQRFWADLASLPTWSARLRFAWLNLLPAPAYMRQRYGVRSSLLLPVVYPYRWMLGLWGWLHR